MVGNHKFSYEFQILINYRLLFTRRNFNIFYALKTHKKTFFYSASTGGRGSEEGEIKLQFIYIFIYVLFFQFNIIYIILSV